MEVKHDTILFVHIDDNKFVQQFMSHFEEKGFNVIHTETYDDAYKLLESQCVHIIVCDMDLSYQEGFKFCYHVKNNKATQGIFILALSAAHSRFDVFLEANTIEAKRWMNVNAWVAKPINAKTLYLLLKRELAILEGIDTKLLDSDACEEHH